MGPAGPGRSVVGSSPSRDGREPGLRGAGPRRLGPNRAGQRRGWAVPGSGPGAGIRAGAGAGSGAGSAAGPGASRARAKPAPCRAGPGLSRAEPDPVSAAWSTISGRAARGKPPGPSRAERVSISGSPLVHSEEAENSHTAAATARAATAASSDAATADHRRAGAPARDANMDTCGRQHECSRVHHRRPQGLRAHRGQE